MLALMFPLAIATGRISFKDNGIASLTAFHDFQPKDKQKAIEIIIEKKEGKQWKQQERRGQ